MPCFDRDTPVGWDLPDCVALFRESPRGGRPPSSGPVRRQRRAAPDRASRPPG